MSINIATPSILFPAITLLMLAYTNRFLALSQLIRTLHKDYLERKSVKTLQQINHLRYRVLLIRLMQTFGASAILFCTVSIFSLLLGFETIGYFCFIFSLIVFLFSLISSLIEILLSSRALNVLLEDIETSDERIIQS